MDRVQGRVAPTFWGRRHHSTHRIPRDVGGAIDEFRFETVGIVAVLHVHGIRAMVLGLSGRFRLLRRRRVLGLLRRWRRLLRLRQRSRWLLLLVAVMLLGVLLLVELAVLLGVLVELSMLGVLKVLRVL